MLIHDCNNDVCRLLNPCIDKLLPYQEVLRRVSDVEKLRYFNIGNIGKVGKMKYDPFDLFDWCSRHMIYQLPNIELIQELSNKIRDVGAKKILEVGSGRGIVCKYISDNLGIKIILTDSYGWLEHYGYKERFEYEDILKRTYIEAIEEFEPDMIIASWIPYNECWTKDFRKYPFVKGYILIGEHRGNATGSEEDWDTDWNIQHLDNAEKYGICKTDHGFCMKDDLFRILHTDVAYFERPK